MQKKLELARFIKFIIVGCLNTAITYICYVALRFFDFGVEVSNLIGYIVGLINSFVWNKKWVFQTKGTNIFKELFAFILVFGVCYIIQFVSFKAMLYEADMNEYLSQFLGMIIYTVMNFILNRFFSFKSKS